MTAQEIRQAYFDFFVKRGHHLIPRAPLVPKEDTTTLFTGSGMQPLIPYLLGEPHPQGKRLVNSQTCLRAQDIDEVGDNRHTTFFEMLGNWSLGDYFKDQEIPWLWEFLTEVIGLNPEKLYITVYGGNKQFKIEPDETSVKLWQSLYKNAGIEAKTADIGSAEAGYRRGMKTGERIFYYDGSKNWWSRAGSEADTPIGDPAGPDTEVFYDFGTVHDSKFGANCHPNCDCGRFMEIANSVFMAYKRTNKGFEPLKKPNVDFGGGLERIAVAKLDNPDIFKISLIAPIITKLEQLSGKNYDNHQSAMRVIADHLRAATFLAVDGVVPSNKEQGYVIRRLIRRAIRYAFELGIEQNFLEELVPVIADLYHNDYPEVASQRQEVIAVLAKEEKAFRQTLRKGLRVFYLMFDLRKDKDTPSDGEVMFELYDTYGFPPELSLEEAYKLGFDVDPNWRKQFDAKMEEQRARSQTAAKGVFKGGLGGQSLQHKKYHTATHLMYQALRDVLGDHVVQHGSNITEERLRFDFSHPEKVTEEQIKQVEQIVNHQIKKDLKITWEEHPANYALEKLKPLGKFGDRYGDRIKIYRMQTDGDSKPFSYEICGGPHVEHTAVLAEGNRSFKIIKEESSSAGIRRIKAILQ